MANEGKKKIPLGTKYPILLRPRRFGKTLFADMLRCYYDINEKDNFDRLFGHTYIGRHRTSMANSYYVLHLNFSGLDTRDTERLEYSFGDYIKSEIEKFLKYYQIDMELDQSVQFVVYVQRFMNQLAEFIPNSGLYVIIDEYDHFANSLLSSKEEFIHATSENGFIRNFYEVLKKHTQYVLGRLFITGVTSMTLDSLTSGFNICENISDYVSMNEVLGFTQREVEALVAYTGCGREEETLSDLKENYNGYLFSERADKRVYNSNMILFYMHACVNKGGRPRRMADPNITGDYQKLVSMFDLYEDVMEKEQVLQSLMRNECVAGDLVTSFSLSTQFTYDHFLSLLYYLGMLTLDEELDDGGYQFRIPNQVIRDIYYDYYFTYLTNVSAIGVTQINEALQALEQQDDIDALVKIVEQIMEDFTKYNNRYMTHFREHTLQTLFFILLRKSRQYRVRMEYEIENGFIDILHMPIRGGVPIVLELKYISTTKYKADEKSLDKATADAGMQVERAREALGNVKGFAIVFAGKKCVYKDYTEER